MEVNILNIKEHHNSGGIIVEYLTNLFSEDIELFLYLTSEGMTIHTSEQSIYNCLDGKEEFMDNSFMRGYDAISELSNVMVSATNLDSLDETKLQNMMKEWQRGI